jgi:hypothetical protein
VNLQRITGHRFSDTSAKSIGGVAQEFEAGIGHPEMNQVWTEIAAAQMEVGLEKASTQSNKPHR